MRSYMNEETQKASQFWIDKFEQASAGNVKNSGKEMTFQGTEKHMTNADRIRAMTDEELVEHFWESFPDEEFCTGNCEGRRDCNVCILEWLQQPYEENDNG